MLSTRTTAGSIGILARHQPILAMLDPTELRLYKSESDIVKFAQGEGYLQVVENSALVLVEEAIAPDELDRADLEEKLKQARARLDRAEPADRDEGTAPRSLAPPERRRATEE